MTGPVWRKSSHSHTTECVEVARVTTPRLPPEAVTTAAAAFSEHMESGEMRPRVLAILTLEAAFPHIAAQAEAAERESIAALAEQHDAEHAGLSDPYGEHKPFADLLRKDTP